MRKVIAAALLVLALAGCGSSGSGDDRSEPPASDDAGLEYTRCMRENGVDLPDAEPGKSPPVIDGPPDSEEHKALEACKQFLPNGGEVEKISPEDLEKVRQYARCMRENGVDMPDPDPDGTITGGAGDSAEMAAADKVCQSKLPGQQG